MKDERSNTRLMPCAACGEQKPERELIIGSHGDETIAIHLCEECQEAFTSDTEVEVSDAMDCDDWDELKGWITEQQQQGPGGEPSVETSAERGRNALAAYAEMAHIAKIQSADENLTDLLTDLAHYCDTIEGVSFFECFRSAETNYTAENPNGKQFEAI